MKNHKPIDVVKKNKLILFIIAGLGYYPVAAQYSAEFNIGSNRMGIEASAHHFIDSKEKWSVSTFNRLFRNHEDKSVGFFTFNSFAYYFKSGVGFSANLSGDAKKFYTSLAAHFEKKTGNLYLHLLTAYALKSKPLNENYIIAAYKYPVNKKTMFFTQIEFYTKFEEWADAHYYERIKLGIEWNKTQVGFFNETFQSSEKLKLHANMGCYFKQSF